MRTNELNQLVMIAKNPVRKPAKDANLVCVKAELFGELDSIRIQTGLTMREIVATMLEYALENTEVVE